MFARSDAGAFRKARLFGAITFTVPLLTTLTLTPTLVKADFDEPFLIVEGPSGDQPTGARIAMNASGNMAYVVWIGSGTPGRIRGVRLSPDPSIPMPDSVSISPPDYQALEPDLSMNQGGVTFIVWRYTMPDSPRIQLRRRAADGALGAIEDVSSASLSSVFLPRVAANVGGDAIIAWQGDNNRVYARFRAANGSYGPTKIVSPSSEFAFNARVAIAKNGMAVVVWQRGNGVKARTRSSDGTWGPIQLISTEGVEPQIAMTPAGNALVVWSRGGLIEARSRAADGVLGSPITLSAPGENSDKAQVAMNGKGNALVVWRETLDGGKSRINVRARSATAVVAPKQALTPSTGVASDPQVAMNGGGHAVVVYTRTDSSNRRRVHARTRSAAGALGTSEQLSARGAEDFPHVAIATNGTAIAVWQGPSNENGTMYGIHGGLGTVP